jgi:hypothetical protein
MARVDIWIWHLEWEDGHTVNLFGSKTEAKGAIQRFVVDNWHDVMPDEAIPADLNDAVARYFQYNGEMEREWYRLEHETVEIPNVSVPAGEDVVELTPLELEVAVDSLSNLIWANFATRRGKSVDEVRNATMSAIAKLGS